MKKFSEILKNQKAQLLIVGIFISLLVSITGFIYYTNEVETITRQKENELKILASLTTNQISEWMIDEINDANLISKNIFLVETVSNYLKSKDVNNKERLKNLLLEIKNEHDYDKIILTDPNTSVIISQQNVFGIDPRLKNAINQSLLQREVLTSDIYFCSVHHELHIDFIAPVFKNNKILAVLIFQFNPEQKFFPLLKRLPTKSYSTESYIGYKEKDSVIVLSELKFKKDSVLKHKYSIKDTNSAIVKAANGYSGFTRAIDYRGEKVVAYVNKIPNTNWFMVSKIDEKELYKDLTRESILIITFLIIIIVSIISSLAFIYSIRQRNIYRQLYYSQNEYQVTLNSIGDAVISTDAGGKINFMNQIAEDLTGWKYNDAIGKPLESVFNIINENTRQSVENPVKKVINEGKIVGLANHTLLISKNGKEIPIADSGAPIKNNEGDILGVVLVFRDQTEERLKRKLIEKSEANLNALINNRTEAIWSLDKNYNLIICNDFFKNAFFNAYNCELKIGINLVEILTPELREFWKPKYDEALSGKKVTFEFSEIILGKRHYFAVYLNPIIINNEITGVTALSTDITELKELQINLKESEEKYRTISDLVSDYVFSTNVSEDGKAEIDWVAGNFEEITGYALEEYKKAGGWVAHLHADSVLQDQEDMKKLLNNEKVVTEVKTITKDNVVVWVRVFAQPYWDENQKRVTKIFGAVQNINDRKLSRLALIESEQKFSAAFNSSPVALSIQDENNTFIDVNEAFCELTGYTKEEVIGKTGAELKLWENNDEAVKANQLFVKQGFIRNYEFRFRKKSGEIRHGIISAESFIINGKKADLTTAIDITELKEKEQKISEQLDELRRWQNVMLDREDRVIELKNEVNELLTKLGKEKKYFKE